MTSETELRDRLTSAVHDTTPPPSFAAAVLAGGRARRRRRTTSALAIATALVVGASILATGLGGDTERRIAERRIDPIGTSIEWARSLPSGAQPGLPFFGADGSLWSGGDRFDVPAEVNRTVPPRAVEGGWLVLLGRATVTRMAVLTPDGGLRRIDGLVEIDGFRLGDSSRDGRRVAIGDVVVDIVTGAITNIGYPTTEAAGQPMRIERPVGFTEQGLVYEATVGGGPPEVSTWLYRDDGTVTRIDPPAPAAASGTPPDLALDVSYSGDPTTTCITSYRLVAERWTQDGQGCMDRELMANRGASPDGRWLLTADLPLVWNLQAGEFRRLDVPNAVAAEWRDDRFGYVVWEDADSLLVPVVDGPAEVADDGGLPSQHVQVVRCRMSTASCERAGDEQVVRIETLATGSTDVRFAQE